MLHVAIVRSYLKETYQYNLQQLFFNVNIKKILLCMFILINSINLKKSFKILFCFHVSFDFLSINQWKDFLAGSLWRHYSLSLSPYDFLSLSRHEKKVTDISHDVVNEVFLLTDSSMILWVQSWNIETFAGITENHKNSWDGPCVWFGFYSLN